MVGALFAVRHIKDATAVRQERRVGSIESHCDGSNVSQGQFHVLFVIGRDESPGFNSGDRVFDQFGFAFVLKAYVGILFPTRETVTVDKVEGEKRVSTRTTLISCSVAVEQLLHRQVEHLEGSQFYVLRILDSLLVVQVVMTATAAAVVVVVVIIIRWYEFLVGFVCLSTCRTRFERTCRRKSPARPAGSL